MKTEYKVGQKFISNTNMNYVRIMAIAEGYAMLRFKGAFPFIKTLKELPEFIKQIS